MKLSVVLIVILFSSLSACTSGNITPIPELVQTNDATIKSGCDGIFPKGSWQFVHAIDFSLKNGRESRVIGITTLAGDAVGCALLTIEGFTLFEARYRDGRPIDIVRAVPPFDKPAFAEGLLRDVMTIFQEPATENVQYGRSVDNLPVCRYIDDGRRVTDIERTVGGCWQIKTFQGAERVMSRLVSGRSCRMRDGYLLPEYIELKGIGQDDYTLKMTLINAENMTR